MTLFDGGRREDVRPKLNAEASFHFLNRTGRQAFDAVRLTLEDWFLRYPELHQADLRAKFRSKHESNHNSAFFELFLHELLIRLGCQVEVHPDVQNTTRHPDFLARSPRGSFYLEAAVVMEESKEELAAQARLHRLYDELNKLTSPDFFVDLNTRDRPKTSASTKRLKSWLKDWLASEDPDQASEAYQALGPNGLPRRHYDLDGLNLEITLIPKRASARGKQGVRLLGSHSDGARWVQTGRAIRDALLSKAGRYGDPPLPYVIAVNVLEPADRNDILEALFGPEQVTVTMRKGEPIDQRLTREPDGLWRNRSGARNTRVSAVLVGAQVFPWNVTRAELCLYPNPWARRVYKSELERLSCAVSRSDGTMQWQEGDSLTSVFDLSPEWPGFRSP